MNLKTYISIKLILFVCLAIVISIITNSITSESRDLRRANKELVFHEKIYQNIIELPVTDVEGKKKLLAFVKTPDSQESIKENYFSTSTLLYFLLMVFVLGFYSMDFLNKKIDKLKSEERDFESQQML